MVFHKRRLWFWPPETIDKTINGCGFWGGMYDMMEAIPGMFQKEPPKAIW